MEDKALIKCLDESVAQFSIMTEKELIEIAMKYIEEIKNQETVSTLISFRARLKNYDEATNHVHHANVDELIFKIDMYLKDLTLDYVQK